METDNKSNNNTQTKKTQTQKQKQKQKHAKISRKVPQAKEQTFSVQSSDIQRKAKRHWNISTLSISSLANSANGSYAMTIKY